ncbi:MAG: YbjN domain-containing protein [Bacteroidetes bacterium]|jgi:hypothetical protein|nr:YbjN domain-containing protein [Bacteroidota bacterium]
MAQDLSAYYFIVDNAMRGLGLEPGDTRGDLPGQWNLAYGDLTVNIDLWEVEAQDGKVVFQVQAPIITLPTHGLAELYRELLEINYLLYANAFSIVEQTVYLKTMRDASGLKEKEIGQMVEFCGFYAEHYQRELLQKYHGSIKL